MNIRWKLLVLLVVIAVVPIVVVRAVDALTLRKFGQEVAGGFREHLMQAAKADLAQQIDTYAEALDREERLIKLIVDSQAEQVERRLATRSTRRPERATDRMGDRLGERPPRPPANRPGDRVADRLGDAVVGVYYDTQFDGVEQPAPPGMERSNLHSRIGRNGRTLAVDVSYATQVVRVQPGVERAAVADTVNRLADMTRVYRRLRAAAPRALLWQYTSFDQGVHFAYPGKGGYSKEYDPRRRPWYTNAKLRGETSWSPPFRDVTTGEVVLSCATPVHNEAGDAIGVTAVDVPVRMLLGRPRGGGVLPDGAQRKLLSMERLGELRASGIVLEADAGLGDLPDETVLPVSVAETGHTDAGGDWRKPVGVSVLKADDPAQLAAVMADMQASRTGIRRITVDGEQRVWGYGPLAEDYNVFLLVSVPIADVIARADAAEAQTLSQMWQSLRQSALIVLIVLVTVVIVALWVSRRFSRPVVDLADTARRIAGGELDARVDLSLAHGRDELHDMADAFNAMVPKLRDQIAVRESLQLAMEVQQALLPETPPEVPGFDIAGNSVYCDETGGDYFDFIDYEEVGPNRLAIIVGDVVGHGIAAALLMATVRGLVRSRAAVPGGTIADAVADVNSELCRSRFSGRFMTAFFLIVDRVSHRLTWLSAGHDPAILYLPDERRFDELAGADIPIGVEDSWSFSEYDCDSPPPGAVIIMGTDGIWECRNGGGEMFGKDRLRRIICDTADQSAQAIAAAIQHAVLRFRGQREQQDDITLVVVKVTG